MGRFRIGPVTSNPGGAIPTFFVLMAIFFTACHGGAPQGASGSEPGTLSPAGATRGSGKLASPTLGTSCQGGANKLCLGVKLVAYTDPSSGSPTIDSAETVSDFRTINSVWAQCDLGFQVDSYTAVNPSTQNLAYETANNEDLTSIRAAFTTETSLLVVLTGTWNRTGSLGGTAANAWTAMPGDGPYGAILEQPVADFPNIIAHELGHYMNLPHVSDTSDLMNPIIYPTSGSLTADQCETARSAATSYWSKMLR